MMEKLVTKINSPLTNGRTNKISELITADVIESYKLLYNIDVKSSFNGRENITLWSCVDSGYEFYFPFDISGNDSFYKQLSTFEWYYSPWKWEHQASLNYIKKAKIILEIGCGSGSFITNLLKRFPEKIITGLEVTLAEHPENFIVNETIEQHLTGHLDYYDLVCSYQVLEHISDVRSFLEASIKVLKKDGHLIIAVPNNDSIFFRKKDAYPLNMPPHHMGRWNRDSLDFLTNIFPLRLEKILYEPIQKYHFEEFQNILKQKMRRRNFSFNFRLSNSNRVMSFLAKLLSRFYKGHTIMFVYQKK